MHIMHLKCIELFQVLGGGWSEWAKCYWERGDTQIWVNTRAGCPDLAESCGGSRYVRIVEGKGRFRFGWWELKITPPPGHTIINISCTAFNFGTLNKDGLLLKHVFSLLNTAQYEMECELYV